MTIPPPEDGAYPSTWPYSETPCGDDQDNGGGDSQVAPTGFRYEVYDDSQCTGSLLVRKPRPADSGTTHVHHTHEK